MEKKERRRDGGAVETWRRDGGAVEFDWRVWWPEASCWSLMAVLGDGDAAVWRGGVWREEK